MKECEKTYTHFKLSKIYISPKCSLKKIILLDNHFVTKLLLGSTDRFYAFLKSMTNQRKALAYNLSDLSIQKEGPA
jgi:hypothetical protein